MLALSKLSPATEQREASRLKSAVAWQPWSLERERERRHPVRPVALT
jgi:hypothetical protein